MSASFAAGMLGAGAVPLAAAAAALGGGPALVVVLGQPAPAPAPAGARARRLAGRLAGAGVAAAAGGRVAWLALGPQDDPSVGLLAARLAAPAPALVAVAGVHDATAEALLAACAAIVVAGDAEDPVVALGVAGLVASGLPARALSPPKAAEAAMLRLGLGPTPARRSALAEALGAGANRLAVPEGCG